MMNPVFASSPGPQAPKRSNSGREIMYIQNQRLIGSGQPVQDAFISHQNLVASREIPHDVADVFNTVLRKYSFRDLYHWLKIDRKDGKPPSLFAAVANSCSRTQPLLNPVQPRRRRGLERPSRQRPAPVVRQKLANLERLLHAPVRP